MAIVTTRGGGTNEGRGGVRAHENLKHSAKKVTTTACGGGGAKVSATLKFRPKVTATTEIRRGKGGMGGFPTT